MKNRRAVVIGGGIAGLLASKLLAMKGYSVTLVDAAAELGGLFRAKTLRHLEFPRGPKYLHKTGITEIDSFLFEQPQCRWEELENYMPSQIINNTIDRKTDSINLTSIPLLQRLLFVLRTCTKRPIDLNNLCEISAFTFYKHFQVPESITERINKFMQAKYNTGLLDIHLAMMHSIMPRRLKLFNSKALVKILKKSKPLDQVLSDPVYTSRSPRHVIYPQNGHFNKWVNTLESNLIANGVTIYKSHSLTNIISSNSIFTIALHGKDSDSDFTINAEKIFTSVALPLNKHAAKPKKEKNKKHQAFAIFLEISQPLEVQNEYITIYDANIIFSRIMPLKFDNGCFGCILEGCNKEDYKDTELIMLAVDYLKHMALLDKEGFAVNSSIEKYSLTYLHSGKHINKKSSDYGQNIIPIGRLSNTFWYTEDMLKFTFEQITGGIES